MGYIHCYREIGYLQCNRKDPPVHSPCRQLLLAIEDIPEYMPPRHSRHVPVQDRGGGDDGGLCVCAGKVSPGAGCGKVASRGMESGEGRTATCLARRGG